MSYYHYQTIQKLLQIYKAWELYDDHSTCDIVFPQLIHGVPWKFDFLIFKKNKQFAEENKKLQYAD